jgi:CRISPR-associated protein Cmr4
MPKDEVTKQAKSILFIHALTGLHPGTGTSDGLIDLPVQRARHTGWPIIPSSSLKGVLRDRARSSGNDSEVKCLFGPEKDNASDHAGALVFTDSLPLLFPVRSLCGLFAWVTCPEVLNYFQRTLDIAENTCDLRSTLLSPLEDGKALVTHESHLLCPTPVTGQNLVLEEYGFAAKEDATAEDKLTVFAKKMDDTLQLDGRLATRLAVIDNDSFAYFVQHAIEVTARIALDYETKTVTKGALFYEEFIPAETVFFSLVLAEPPRNNKCTSICDASQALTIFTDITLFSDENGRRPILQIGANATIGKGYCQAVMI